MKLPKFKIGWGKIAFYMVIALIAFGVQHSWSNVVAPPTGKTMATDEVSGSPNIHYSKEKVCDGTPGSENCVQATAPIDGATNPTAALETKAYLMCWNASASTWSRCQMGSGSSDAGMLVTLASDTVFNLLPSTEGGATPYVRVNDAGADAEVLVTGSGQFYSIYCTDDTSDNDSYLVLYDTATTPIPGTTTVLAKFGIPGHDDLAGGQPINMYGIPFLQGAGIAFVSDIAVNGSTAAAANDVLCTIQIASEN